MKEDFLLDGNLKKTYFRFTIPVVCSMVITLVYNMADT